MASLDGTFSELAGQRVHQIPDAPGGLSLDQIVAILRRRFVLIVIVAAMGTSLAVGAASVISPSFESTAVVEVDQTEPEVSSIIGSAPASASGESVITTKMELLGSRELLSGVINELKLDQDPVLNPPPHDFLAVLPQALASWVPLDWLKKVDVAADASQPTDAQGVDASKEAFVDRVRRSLEVTRPSNAGGTVMLSFTSPSSTKSALIANALADAYLRWEIEHRQDIAREASVWIRQQLEQLQAAVEQAEQAVARFRVEHSLAAAATSGTLNDQRVVDLKAQLIALRAEQIQKKAKLTQAKNASGGSLALADLPNSPTLLQLRAQQADLEQRQAEFAQVFGARHPQMLDIQAQLDTVAQRIRLEVGQTVAAMRDDLVSVAAREQAIQNELDHVQSGSQEDRQAEIELQELQRHANVSRDRYETLLARYRQALEQIDFPASGARVISRAAPPSLPSTPGKIVFAAVGFTASLMLATMLAFVAEQLDRRVQNTRQLQRSLGIPSLGTLPIIKGRRWRELPASYISQSPFTYFAEAAQSILARLDQGAGTHRPTTLMVTSALPDEGKSTLAVALAAAAVRGGATACVVDLDLRHPSVSTKFEPTARSPGVFDYANGTAILAEVLRHDAKSNVSFVPAGSRPTNPIMVIKSYKLDELLESLRVRYNIVVIDLPPLLALSETAAATRLGDCFILATRWQRTETAAAAEAAAQLRSAVGQKFIGFVLTFVDPKKYHVYGRDEAAGYYRKYRKYYIDG